jgi:RNA polymerase sigma-70 factor (ECF subfamily)
VNGPKLEEEWAALMRLANSGDAAAYHKFLGSIVPFVRASSRKNCARVGLADGDAEDIVQEVLLALHLKRHTWDQDRAIGPWIAAITRNKVIDALRRRGHRIIIALDDVVEDLAEKETSDPLDQRDLERMFLKLNDRQRDIVKSVSLDGTSIRATAERLQMSEGAVRVALHRALKTLATLYRSSFV